MRKILFRGKNEATKEWKYGYLLSKNVIGEVVNTGSDYSVTLSTVIQETVGQFIDKEDCEGANVFEGDKVFLSYSGRNREGVVSFNDRTNAFVVSIIDSKVIVHFGIIDSLLVIGNIHENK